MQDKNPERISDNNDKTLWNCILIMVCTTPSEAEKIKTKVYVN